LLVFKFIWPLGAPNVTQDTRENNDCKPSTARSAITGRSRGVRNAVPFWSAAILEVFTSMLFFDFLCPHAPRLVVHLLRSHSRRSPVFFLRVVSLTRLGLVFAPVHRRQARLYYRAKPVSAMSVAAVRGRVGRRCAFWTRCNAAVTPAVNLFFLLRPFRLLPLASPCLDGHLPPTGIQESTSVPNTDSRDLRETNRPGAGCAQPVANPECSRGRALFSVAMSDISASQPA